MLVTRPQDTAAAAAAASSQGAADAAAAPAPGGEGGAASGGDGGEDGGATTAVAAPGDGGDSGGVPLVELKSFTTQVFFAAWRGLHLGLLQVFMVSRRFCRPIHTLLFLRGKGL